MGYHAVDPPRYLARFFLVTGEAAGHGRGFGRCFRPLSLLLRFVAESAI